MTEDDIKDEINSSSQNRPELDPFYFIEKPALDDNGNPTGGVVREYPNMKIEVVSNQDEGEPE